MIDVQQQFIEYAKAHGVAFEEGDSKQVNKIHSKLMNLHRLLVDEGKQNVLQELIHNPEDYVQLWAATFLLKSDSGKAITILKELSTSPKVIGLTASSLIDLWNKGMLPFG